MILGGFEEPGSVGVRTVLDAHGLRPVPVPVDADGVDVAALARAQLRAVMVTPAHQYPTGVVLAPARRAALLEWARNTGGLVTRSSATTANRSAASRGSPRTRSR